MGHEVNESSSNDRALDAVNRRRTGFFRPSLQNALGAFMVVLVTTSAGVVLNLRDIARGNAEQIEDHMQTAHAKHPVEREEVLALREQFNIHESKGKYKHAIIDKALEHEHEAIKKMQEFMDYGGRFSQEDAKEMREMDRRLERRIQVLEISLQACGCVANPIQRFNDSGQR